MIAVRASILLVACLALSAGLARVWPASPRYVDLMALPVVWYAVVRSQRSAMIVGSLAGLAYDAWFRVGVFGMGGFVKTFLGWATGAVGSRIDLNPQLSRLAATFVFVWLHGPLEIGLRRLLDQETAPPSPLEWTLRAAITGLLAVALFPILDRGLAESRKTPYPGER